MRRRLGGCAAGGRTQRFLRRQDAVRERTTDDRGAIEPVAELRKPRTLKKEGSNDYEYIINDYGSYATQIQLSEEHFAGRSDSRRGWSGCTNAQFGYGKGIIWNAGRNGTSGNYLITEYAVPSNKMIRSLTLSYEYTSSCAMNTSGDLAVGVLCSNSTVEPPVNSLIFKNATGKPTVYKTPLDREYFDGYDSSGNLFADGQDSSYNFMLVELPKGNSKAVTIKTSGGPSFPGSVQWDGKYVAVFDQSTLPDVPIYSISGTTATLEEHRISYSGTGDCAQTWLVKGLMYCGDAGNDSGEGINYPAGGSAKATFSGSFDFPLGVTAAKK